MAVSRRALATVARRAIEDLTAQARPVSTFDASRYFRTTTRLRFLNTGATPVRELGKTIARSHRDEWTVDDAVVFADRLIGDDRFEVKGLAIETLAPFKRGFTRSHLPIWKRWLAAEHAANWATTDAICGSLIGPLLLRHPDLVATVTTWSRHRNLWVRRASAVSLVKPAARGMALEAAYAVAETLHADRHDLIQKAVGWLLREAGRTDGDRLERYLRANGPHIPRTTVRYAIERFAPADRQALLAATRPDRRAGEIVPSPSRKIR